MREHSCQKKIQEERQFFYNLLDLEKVTIDVISVIFFLRGDFFSEEKKQLCHFAMENIEWDRKKKCHNSFIEISCGRKTIIVLVGASAELYLIFLKEILHFLEGRFGMKIFLAFILSSALITQKISSSSRPILFSLASRKMKKNTSAPPRRHHWQSLSQLFCRIKKFILLGISIGYDDAVMSQEVIYFPYGPKMRKLIFFVLKKFSARKKWSFPLFPFFQWWSTTK